MNTKLFFLTILFFISTSLFAQKFDFGIKVGANLSKISGKSFKDEFTFGYHAGVFASVGGDKFYIQPEVLFNQVNTDTASDFSQVYQFNKINNIQLHYLSIPVMLGYKLNKIISLQAGPQFGILLDQNKNLLENGKDAFKSGNFSLAGGIQVKLAKIRVYGRYVGGTTNLDNVGKNDTWKLSSIQIGVGVAF